MSPALRTLQVVAIAALALNSIQKTHGASLSVVPAERELQDVRIQPLKDLDGYFPFTPSDSAAAWNTRAESVRTHLKVALGLWPMPTKSPLNSVIHGKKDFADYTLEKVYFESAPGFFVTGNLYRPKKTSGKSPGVLCPHGHWSNGRFLDSGEAALKQEIVHGAERFADGGRSVLQSRCVQLAKMGCVVFHYDMLGYADSVQIPMSVAHDFAKQRPEMNTAENWGLFSPQAESHLQSVMMLQTWNSIRSLDFLESLPDVDSSRLACTGASGGGTQTFILAALDPRIKVAFPAVMVSTAMQGGCTCENASLLRVNTGNVEFAALFAPKPLGMTCANDWTREMSTKGFPELQRHYQLLGARENVMLHRGEQFGHNYNYVSRAAMYSWLNKHLGLGLAEPILEGDYHRLSAAELTVWDAAHPAPKTGPDVEREIVKWFHKDAQDKLRAQFSKKAEWKAAVQPALGAIIGRSLQNTGRVEWDQTVKEDHSSWILMGGLLKNTEHHEEVPAIFCYPKEWNGRTVLWLSGNGKQALLKADRMPVPEAQSLIDGGTTVVSVDLFETGEFRRGEGALVKTRRVNNPREVPAYTFGYNNAVFAQRVHDVLTAIQFIQNHERPSKRIDLLALDGTGAIGAAARAVAGKAIGRAALDLENFRFGDVNDSRSPSFLPGGAKYGDVDGMLALTGDLPTHLIHHREIHGYLPSSLGAGVVIDGRVEDLFRSLRSE